MREAIALAWLSPGRGYGFPVPQSIRDLLVGDDSNFLLRSGANSYFSPVPQRRCRKRSHGEKSALSAIRPITTITTITPIT